MKIKEIGFVSYIVTDLNRSRKFYEGVLGLIPSTQIDADAQWVEYDLGPGAALSIGMWGEFKPGKEGGTAALEVEDFDLAIKELKEKNIKFSMETLETPVCHMAIVEDPDGNLIMIHKRK